MDKKKTLIKEGRCNVRKLKEAKRANIKRKSSEGRGENWKERREK